MKITIADNSLAVEFSIDELGVIGQNLYYRYVITQIIEAVKEVKNGTKEKSSA